MMKKYLMTSHVRRNERRSAISDCLVNVFPWIQTLCLLRYTNDFETQNINFENRLEDMDEMPLLVFLL